MKNIFLLTLGLLMCYSCADLDELEPVNSIPSGSAIIDFASAQAALNGVYDGLQDEDFDKWLSFPQYFSDEAEATGTFPSRLEFGNLNVFPANATLDNVFTSLYITINRANNVITLVPEATDENFTQEQRNDIVAQAQFIRAHNYLHLITFFQDVPLILTPTTDLGEALNVTTSPVAVIYDQIVTDFTASLSNLQAESGSFIANRQAANAFLARVALYQERWQDALNFAQAALGDGFDLSSFPYLQDQIYSLGYSSNDGNSLSFFYGVDGLGGRYSIGPSQALINAYEPGDLRFAQTLDTASFPQAYGVKYPSFEAGTAGTAPDPIYFIRHAEMVLIMAEASAELGDFATASTMINQVRARAGLEAVTLDATNYVDLILQERFVEFAFEGPFRLIDLRRRGRAEEVLGPIGYDACDDIWPLPQRDVDRNPNLSQNDCCNC